MRVHRAAEPRLPVVLVTGLIAAFAGWALVRATIGRAPEGSTEVRAATEGADDANAEAANGDAANDDANGDAADDDANAEAPNAEGPNAEAPNADAPNADAADTMNAEAANAEAANAEAANVEPANVEPQPANAEATSPEAANAEANAAANTNPGTSTAVRRGRVAYIRCGETERCPRDAALEDATWAMLEALPSCARLAGQAGSADVRIHFEAESAEVRFRDHGDRPLAIPALRGCLAGPSAALRTTLTPRPLTASFRFDLVAE